MTSGDTTTSKVAERTGSSKNTCRSKKTVKSPYQVILQDIQKLRDGDFILYQEYIGHGGNTITITKKGTRWVEEAQAALEEVYDQFTDPEP